MRPPCGGSCSALTHGAVFLCLWEPERFVREGRWWVAVGKPGRPGLDEAIKTKALTIAEAATIREASEQTGVPQGTIRRWRFESGIKRANKSNRASRVPKNLKPLAREAVEQAVAEAGDYITARLKGLADNLYGLAEKAATKIDVAIADPNELPIDKVGEPHDRDGAAWVRALVGVLAQAIDKAQLISGKPTARPELMKRYEFDITQRIIADPEAVQLANTVLRRAAGRNPGTLCLDRERGAVDSV